MSALDPVGSVATMRQRVYPSIGDVVGNTALIRLDLARLGGSAEPGGTEIYLKMECDNPMSSVKDRIGRAMIDDAETRGLLVRGSPGWIIEPTSGNTGIALAFIAASRGYRLTLVMPESMSLERRAMLRHLGAELVLTPAEKGMRGAVERAAALVEEARSGAGDVAGVGKVFMPQQFENPANPLAHERTTGPEIWNDLGGRVDAIVSGVGTGGTITGVTRYVRGVGRNPAFKAIAVEPELSPVISGGAPGRHKIQGIGAGFVPKNLDVSLVDEVIKVRDEDAVATARLLARTTGIMGGISTGANVWASLRLAARPEWKGKRIVTICCSFAERYLSTVLFEGEVG
jgi:cysteine synthase A